ncbi:UDP-N-acetylglucosamine 2-epimerase (non-hydrolyzing) [Candidatus Marinamargulisbacteria bacterium SCGC AAA071-K20]|nr:UDP-N-acetylglucosamine 2-epimerase (non-hydrolyzing) [Candidatus Marinamargulisbacteria bacterium SCGC AAA071-K20]
MRKKICFVAAARPNFMKIAPIYNEILKFPKEFQAILVHTGQHYDKNMSDTFFDQLNIPKPNISLGLGSGTHAQQTARTMIAFETVLNEKKPDLVVVVGDVNATLACSITAKKLHIPVAHIESGLRSFDQMMPEEINRLVTDKISDFLYTPSEDADQQLLKEGTPKENIIFVGNVMIDTLKTFKPKAAATKYFKKLGLTKQQYITLTLHRPSNVDDKVVFKDILTALKEISGHFTIICPIHPRTKKQIKEFKLDAYVNMDGIKKNKINLIEPIGYFEMMNLVMNSRLVLTDSGGLQEETTVLKVPCITLRENTERPITITQGSNHLVGTSSKKICDTFYKVSRKPQSESQIPKYWDGNTAKRIVKDLIKQSKAGRF